MQKRKLKLNILDVTLVILVICATVALIFRDTVNDALTKPEIILLEVTVTSDKNENSEAILSVGNLVTLEANAHLQAVVSKSLPGDNSVNAVLTCNGYKKLGRYYTENGDLLSPGTEFAVSIGDVFAVCRVESAEITGR